MALYYKILWTSGIHQVRERHHEGNEPPLHHQTPRGFNQQARIYFLMLYYPLGNMRQQLRLQGKFPEDIVRLMAAQLALAISTLHAESIVYRDLKPENILIGNDGYLVLADFGVSRQLKPGEASLRRVGTVDYIATEIQRGQPHSFPVDWWSLGVLLYELLVA